MPYKYISTILLTLMNPPSWASSKLPITVESANYHATAQPIEKPIVLNKIHAWIVNIDNKSGSPVQGLKFQVSGGMPAHRHGFPTQPQLIKEVNPGEYIIDGLKFNMLGEWQIELINSTSESSFHLLFEFDLDHEIIK